MIKKNLRTIHKKSMTQMLTWALNFFLIFFGKKVKNLDLYGSREYF